MALLTDEERELDPYLTLGIAPDAAEKDIRKAYRKLSLKCHPDKNSGPEAAEMFHSISLALAILTSPEKRSFVDGKLATARAQAARRAEMDSKRKAKVDDLLRREEDAKRARKDAADQRKAAAAEEAVRSEGRRLMEERKKRMEAAAAAAREADAPKPTIQQRDGPPPISDEDLTITLTLPVGYTQATLEAALSKYGAVEAVHVVPSKKKPKAIVQFALGNWGGCWACVHDGAGIGAKVKWAAGKEPAWVAWAAQQKERGEGNEQGRTFKSAPDFGDVQDRQRQREEDAALESATLLRMRQRERERLAEEIRRAEEEV